MIYLQRINKLMNRFGYNYNDIFTGLYDSIGDKDIENLIIKLCTIDYSIDVINDSLKRNSFYNEHESGEFLDKRLEIQNLLEYYWNFSDDFNKNLCENFLK